MRNPELMLTHPSAQKERLLELVEQIPGAWVGIKIAALLLVLEGQGPGWICEVLGLTRMSLGRWIHGVNAEGIETLNPKAIPGRPSQLNRKVEKVLQKHLDQSPQSFGLNRARWDGPTLVTHLKRQFGITLQVRQAQQWMHQLGYRMKRASYSYLQAKSEEAKRFRRSLKKTPLPESE
jgi:transposase